MTKSPKSALACAQLIYKVLKVTKAGGSVKVGGIDSDEEEGE